MIRNGPEVKSRNGCLENSRAVSHSAVHLALLFVITAMY
jgi:hypothetical protein